VGTPPTLSPRASSPVRAESQSPTTQVRMTLSPRGINSAQPSPKTSLDSITSPIHLQRVEESFSADGDEVEDLLDNTSSRRSSSSARIKAFREPRTIVKMPSKENTRGSLLQKAVTNSTTLTRKDSDSSEEDYPDPYGVSTLSASTVKILDAYPDPYGVSADTPKTASSRSSPHASARDMKSPPPRVLESRPSKEKIPLASPVIISPKNTKDSGSRKLEETDPEAWSLYRKKRCEVLKSWWWTYVEDVSCSSQTEIREKCKWLQL
jgi:hypothetical protein